MNVIVCVDKNDGIGFNFRRQTSDAAVISRAIETFCFDGVNKLWFPPYSADLFRDRDEKIVRADDDWLNCAAVHDFCFVEGLYALQLRHFENKIKAFVVYRWDRAYPADCFFNLLYFISSGWRIIRREVFDGTSHENITEEIYIK